MARFVNLERYFDPQQAEAMGQRAMQNANPALSQADSDIANLRAGVDVPGAQGDVNAAQAKLAMAGSTSGLQGMMNAPQKNANGVYEPQSGANAMDGWMAGQSNAVGGARTRYANLTKQLGQAQYAGQLQNNLRDVNQQAADYLKQQQAQEAAHTKANAERNAQMHDDYLENQRRRNQRGDEVRSLSREKINAINGVPNRTY